MKWRKLQGYCCLIVATCFCILFLASCTKSKTTESKVVKALQSKIPESAFGYFIWDGSNKAYENYLNSPWIKSGSKLANDIINSAIVGQSKEKKSISNILNTLGILESGNNKQGIKIAMGYVGVANKQPKNLRTLHFAMFSKSKDTSSAQQLVEKLQQELSSEKEVSIDSSCENYSGFTVTKNSSKSTEKLYVCFNENELAISNQKEQITWLFSKPPAEISATHILKSTELKKISNSFKDRSNEYLFAFSDLDKLLQLIPKEAKAEFSDFDLPFKAVGISRQMGPKAKTYGPKDIALVSLKESDELQKLDSILSKNKSIEALKQLDQNTAFSIGINTKLFEDLVKKINNKSNSQKPVKEYELLDNVKSFAIGVQKASAGSPFPIISAVIKGIDSKQISNLLEQQVNNQIKRSGFNAFPWQKKQVAGTEIRYLATPFGVGLFTGAASDTFIASTSEASFSNGIQGTSEHLLTNLAKQFSELEPEQALALISLDFVKVSQIVSNVQQTLAMFTGGKSNLISPKQLDEMKNFGHLIGTVHYKNKMLQFTSKYGTSS